MDTRSYIFFLMSNAKLAFPYAKCEALKIAFEGAETLLNGEVTLSMYQEMVERSQADFLCYCNADHLLRMAVEAVVYEVRLREGYYVTKAAKAHARGIINRAAIKSQNLPINL